MTALTVFNFDAANSIRVIMDEKGEPMFVASDVANALGYSRPNDAVNQHCDDATAQHRPIQDSMNRTQQVRVIDESDMYALIFGSKLESAKRFKKWVTSEVLPTIRKTGSFIGQNSNVTVDFAKEAAILSPSFVDMAKAFGFVGNQAYLSADKAIFSVTGVSPLKLMGATLVAPVQEPLLTPSDISLRLGLGKFEANKLLTLLHLQTNHRDHKNVLYYELTSEGSKYGEYHDTGKKHSDGTPVRQLKWHNRVLDVIRTLQ